MKFSKYHIVVMGIYFVLIPFLIFFFPEKIVFKLVSENNQWAIGIFIAALLIFFSVLKWKGELIRITITPRILLAAIIYGFLFAFPEEILFRGVIQGLLIEHFNVAISILISSFIFGAAHLLNGAKSFKPNGWSWNFSFFVFLVGLPLGGLYWLTGSLLVPIILHMIFVVVLQLVSPAKVNLNDGAVKIEA